ncbi:hypothetical protein A2229_01075 [Candidatus Peregrinibacteria bacterium RIFOXYA2_FULL_33_7]|nr:MAG: hypothetical protein A2229_01075 [Candidatus Peregrinibacteria bacterium RIFOXYA2_FULL_33_7]
MKQCPLSTGCKKLKQVFLRFPQSILAAIAISVICLFVMDFEKEPPAYLIKTLFTLIISVPLFLGLNIFFEKTKYKKTKALLFSTLIGMALLSIFLLLTPNISLNTSFQEKHIAIQFFLATLMSVLFVFCAPFLTKKPNHNFHSYSRQIIIRFIFSAISTAILFVGVLIAYFTLAELLNIKFFSEENTILRTWILLFSIFNTIFFLISIPQKTEKENLTNIETILSNYVILPLIIIYFSILISYLIKIFITNTLPQSWIALPIIGYSILVLSFQAIKMSSIEDKNNKNLLLFSKILNISLIITVPMLFWSVWERIKQYGITEPRYYLIILGIWIIGSAIYLAINKERNLQYLIISFIALTLISYAGPLSSFSISKNNQINRLEKILQKNSLFDENNKIQIPANFEYVEENDLQINDKLQINEILNYLYYGHGFENIKNWFPDEVYVKDNDQKTWNNILAYLKLGNFEEELTPIFYTIDEAANQFQKIENYQYLFRVYGDEIEKESIIKNTEEIKISSIIKNNNLILQIQNQEIKIDVLNFINNLPTPKNINEINNHFQEYTQEALSLNLENEKFKIKLNFHNINTQKSPSKTVLNSIDATAFLSLK